MVKKYLRLLKFSKTFEDFSIFPNFLRKKLRNSVKCPQYHIILVKLSTKYIPILFTNLICIKQIIN